MISGSAALCRQTVALVVRHRRGEAFGKSEIPGRRACHLIVLAGAISSTGATCVTSIVDPAICRLGALTADAGADRNVRTGERVELNGSSSTDSAGATLTFQWEQTSGPKAAIANPAGALAGFVPVEEGIYTFTLTVENGNCSDEDTVEISVGGTPPPPCPRAEAGLDESVNEGALNAFCLDGSASVDPNGRALTYEWVQLGDPRVVLRNPHLPEPCFSIPQDVTEDTVLTFELTADNGDCRRTDSVNITIKDLVSPCSDVICDDDDLCTDDRCAGGSCVFEPINCESGVGCDPATGDCVAESGCAMPEDCDDANPCTDDSCRSGRCEYANNSAMCNDRLFCTKTDVCIAGTCVGSNSPCNDGPCDEETKRCADGACDDKDPCTTDVLVNADCTSTPIDCDDGDPCTDDRCEEGTCTHVEPQDACVVAEWSNSPLPVNVDVDWTLPNGSNVPINRCGSTSACSESACLESELLADGLHGLRFMLHGDARTTNFDVAVRFPGLCMTDERQLLGPYARNVGIEINDGVAQTVFDDGVPHHDPEWIRVSGVPALEYIGGWQLAPNIVNLDLQLTPPSGNALQAQRRHGPDHQGFERITLPSIPMDGTYRADFELRGAGRTAEAAMILRVGEWTLRHEGLLIGDLSYVIGFDVTGGTARTVFNGWLNGTDAGGGSLTGVHAIEINAGWRQASANVNVDIALRLPSGARAEVWRNGPALQGFERIYLPAGTTLADGNYTLEFVLKGNGRQASITYQAMLANWSFEALDQVLNGPTNYSVTLEIRGGTATELSNSWR